MTYKEHMGSFAATTQGGQTMVLHSYVQKIDVSTLSGGHQTVDGMKSIVTANGEPVNYLEKGKYKLVSTGQELYSSDANCP